jgi:serine phosphatase RsbU (regulator of sigma subunit)
VPFLHVKVREKYVFSHIETQRNNDRKWEALLRISEESRGAKSIEDFICTVREILSDLIMARNFFIGLYEESVGKYFFPFFEDEYDTVETTFKSYTYDESLDENMYDLSGTLSDYVRRTGKPVRYPNQEIERLEKKGEIKLFGTPPRSLVGVPLKLSRVPVGVMVIQDYDRADAYTREDEKLMVFVSDYISRAIEIVRAEEKERGHQKLLLEQAQAITDSVIYARRIQKTVLPSKAWMDGILTEYFVIYKPKDILSGDFYWVRRREGYKMILVADCTGHGVPGAMMSMLGVTLLNELIRTIGVKEPAEMLEYLRGKVKDILSQEESGAEQREGMEMSLILIDPAKKELHFAGANRPLFLFREKGKETDPALVPDPFPEEGDHALYILQGDRQPLGVYWEETPFTNYVTGLQEGDCLYMFSDGFVDQFGGERRRKFKMRNFKNLLLSVQAEPMARQMELLDAAFENWKGKNEQIDDVTLFGLKIHLS